MLMACGGQQLFSYSMVDLKRNRFHQDFSCLTGSMSKGGSLLNLNQGKGLCLLSIVENGNVPFFV